MKQFDKITGYPPELRGRLNSFIVTEFDDSMTVEMQLRVLIKWIMKNIDLTNAMVDYLNEFIKNFDEKLYKTVSDILNKWLQDGIITEILNEEIIKQLLCMKKNNVYMCDFPRLEGEKDDTQRLQRAVNSFDGNFGGTVNLSDNLYVSGQITINKTGVKLKGVSNKKSKIISSWRGTTLHVEPLRNGKPYTNSGYCRFFIEDVTFLAVDDAVVMGTGIYLKWVFGSSFINLFTSGFLKHIVFKGSHLNNFYNYYAENADEYGKEHHNRGVAWSSETWKDEAGETSSNNNAIFGGWLHNTSLDLRGNNFAKISHIDIEPASDTIYTGNGSVFTQCRFERLCYYAYASSVKPYEKFPWFTIANKCTFKDNIYTESGAQQTRLAPIFLIEGSNNFIEYPVESAYDYGTFTFSEDSKSNNILVNKPFNDYLKTLNNAGYKHENSTFNGKLADNKISFIDFQEATETVYFNDYQKPTGVFESYTPMNNKMEDWNIWAVQGLTLSKLNEQELKKPVGYENDEFFKISVKDASDIFKRVVLIDKYRLEVTESGVYTVCLTYYIPANTSVPLRFSISTGATYPVDTRDKWITFQQRGYFKAGEKIQPQILLSNGGLSDTAYFGGFNVVKGNCGAYFRNDTSGKLKHKF